MRQSGSNFNIFIRIKLRQSFKLFFGPVQPMTFSYKIVGFSQIMLDSGLLILFLGLEIAWRLGFMKIEAGTDLLGSCEFVAERTDK